MSPQEIVDDLADQLFAEGKTLTKIRCTRKQQRKLAAALGKQGTFGIESLLYSPAPGEMVQIIADRSISDAEPFGTHFEAEATK